MEVKILNQLPIYSKKVGVPFLFSFRIYELHETYYHRKQLSRYEFQIEETTHIVTVHRTVSVDFNLEK